MNDLDDNNEVDAMEYTAEVSNNKLYPHARCIPHITLTNIASRNKHISGTYHPRWRPAAPGYGWHLTPCWC